MERQYHVYILTNRHHTVLYTGLTSSLIQRVYQHRTKALGGFTSRYNVDRLVFFEEYADAWAATGREKQIKAGSRAKKIPLIEAQNPEWRDLYDELAQGIASSLRSLYQKFGRRT